MDVFYSIVSWTIATEKCAEQNKAKSIENNEAQTYVYIKLIYFIRVEALFSW